VNELNGAGNRFDNEEQRIADNAAWNSWASERVTIEGYWKREQEKAIARIKAKLAAPRNQITISEIKKVEQKMLGNFRAFDDRKITREEFEAIAGALEKERIMLIEKMT
jgi:hypothetical protein